MNKLAPTQYLRLASDLHLDVDVGKRFKPENLWFPEVLPEDKETTLVLPGDLWHSKKYLSFSNYSWLKELSTRFQYVVVVLGNHDFYGGNVPGEYQKFEQMLKEQGITNVFLLQNSTLLVGDLKFVGGTLWTNFNNGNPTSMSYAQYGENGDKSKRMNDYRFIRAEGYQKLRATHLTGYFSKTRNYIFEHAKRDYPEQKVLVVTHHAPSYQSIPSHYQKDDETSFHVAGAYFSNLEEDIKGSDVDYWFHGHTHQKKHYQVGNTQVVVNPRGYHGHEKYPTGFDPVWRLKV